MRQTESIGPMWKDGPAPTPISRALAASVRTAAGLLRRLSPAALRWAEGMHPELRLAWGATEFHVRRDGIVPIRREGAGWEDNPRSNYNERVRKRQEREARESEEPAEPATAADAPEPPGADDPAKDEPNDAPERDAAQGPPVNFSHEALQSEVRQRMGITDDAPDAGELPRDADGLKARMSELRAVLQSLDDVSDWDLVDAVDDELYLLHKAVEYKLREHKASEAKARLGNLFK